MQPQTNRHAPEAHRPRYGKTSSVTRSSLDISTTKNVPLSFHLFLPQMKVPEYKKKEVLKIIEATQEGQITAQQLAECLRITKRSANRILSALEEQGVVEITKTRATSAKGRPERIYKIV